MIAACDPDVDTLGEIEVLSFGAKHKTSDSQNKRNIPIKQLYPFNNVPENYEPYFGGVDMTMSHQPALFT